MRLKITLIVTAAISTAFLSFGQPYFVSPAGNDQNPGTLKIVMPDKPVDVNPVGLMLPMGEGKLKSVLDATLTKFILNGFVKASFRKNALDYDLWSVAAPYNH